MRHSIMTEKIARRGVRVLGEYSADFLGQLSVKICAKPVVTLRASESLERVRAWLASGTGGTNHQGFPVLDQLGKLVGVVTRRELLEPQEGASHVRDLVRRSPVFVSDDASLRDVADMMASERIGRLPVLSRQQQLLGIVTRSDLIDAHAQRLDDHAPRQLRRLGLKSAPLRG